MHIVCAYCECILCVKLWVHIVCQIWNTARDAAGVSLPTEHLVKQGSRLAFCSIGVKTSVERLWNGTDRGTQQNWHSAVVSGTV